MVLNPGSACALAWATMRLERRLAALLALVLSQFVDALVFWQTSKHRVQARRGDEVSEGFRLVGDGE